MVESSRHVITVCSRSPRHARGMALLRLFEFSNISQKYVDFTREGDLSGMSVSIVVIIGPSVEKGRRPGVEESV